MELRHLRYFVTLAHELHFARAAAQLGISQPPLSQQIRALETELGTQLLIRTSRRAKLTEAGRLFLLEAEKILAEVDHAREVVRRAGQGETGELSIGFTPSAPLTAVFRKSLQTFRASFPKVRLVLHEMSTQNQIQGLADGRLQICFLRTGGQEPAIGKPLTALKIDREELVLILPVGHPCAQGSENGRIPLGRVSHEDFITFPSDFGGGTYDQIIARCRADGFEPRIMQEAREAVTLLGLVAAGLGVTLLASSFGSILLDGLVARRIEEPAPMAETWLAYSKEDNSSLVRAFLTLVARFQRR